MKKSCNDLFKEAFSAIAPSDSNEVFEKSIAERAKNMKEHRHKISAKPIIIAFAAAIGVFAATISVGAATGLFGFNAIFGRTIRAENETLSETLLGTAENVKTTSSDSDYLVKLRGVSGTETSVIANIEISRADGKPVSDFFKNPLGETNLHGFSGAHNIADPVASTRTDYNYSLDENGNILVTVELSTASDGSVPVSLANKQIVIDGSDFFPASAVMEYASENGVSPSSRENLGEGANAIAALLMDWSVEFVYKPSEASLVVKTCESPSEKFTVYPSLDQCTVDSISLSSTSGLINGTHESGTIGFLNEYSEILLIRADGSTVKAVFDSGAECDGEFSWRIRYCAGERANTLAVDMTGITAISINGTVYAVE